MSEQEMLERIKELEEENKTLRDMLENKIKCNDTSAYEIISNLISNKVNNEVHEDFKHSKQTIKRKIMEDVKWELHVRYANNLKKEDIEPAKEYINKYEIDKLYKNPRGTF